MKQSDLKKLINKAYNNAKRSIGVFATNDNPQVVTIKNKYIGQCEAFEAVLAALDNDTLFLRIMSNDYN